MPARRADDPAYWRARQDRLKTNWIPDNLEPHEIIFYEWFIEVDQYEIELIPRDPPRPTNDIRWRGKEYEVKRTAARYAAIKTRIKDDLPNKQRFLIDLHDKPLSNKLRRQLELYNARNPDNRITELWVSHQGGTEQIVLL